MPDKTSFDRDLIERVKENLRQAWRAGRPRTLEDYLSEAPTLSENVELLLELIYTEVLIREQNGETPRLEDYSTRFPHLAGELALQFQAHEALGPAGAPTLTDAPPDGVGTVDTGPPKRLAGYEILGQLGRGGMGVVYQAQHPDSRVLVAIKLMREGLEGAQETNRFVREAEVLKKLSHPNIVRLLDAGRHDGRPYLVMELITGGSLAQTLAGKPQSSGQVAAHVEALARAIHEAHQAGVVHRDLKPANVLVTAEGSLKITDFGLAKLEEATAYTVSGQIMGSVPYMAPEQAIGRSYQATAATDVWALGVILYEMVTGQLPFQGETSYQVLEQVCNADPPPPRQLRPDVDRDLETICLKCLRKESTKRYGTALELADDLRRYQEDRPIKARRVGVGERVVKWRRRHPVTSALGLALVLLALVGAAGWLWYWDRYQRVKVEYYGAIVSRLGVKEGITPLSEAEVRGRHVSYKLYRRGGRVEQVDIVNGQGELTTRHRSGARLERLEGVEGSRPATRECRYVYRWKQDGKLDEEVAQDRHGNVVWKLHYTAPTLAQFTRVLPRSESPEQRPAEGRAETIPSGPIEGTPQTDSSARGRAGTAPTGMIEGLPEPRARSGASFVEIVWTDEGFERETRFRDGNGRRVPDDGGSSVSAVTTTSAARS
jgi:serine/threonine-protein kinase